VLHPGGFWQGQFIDRRSRTVGKGASCAVPTIHTHRRRPEVLAAFRGEPRRMAAMSLPKQSSFEARKGSHLRMTAVYVLRFKNGGHAAGRVRPVALPTLRNYETSANSSSDRPVTS
jgi:hypothetical protein